MPEPIRTEILDFSRQKSWGPHRGVSHRTQRAMDREAEDALRRISHVDRDACVAGAIVEASAALARLGVEVLQDLARRELVAAAEAPHATRRYFRICENVSLVASEAVLTPATCRRP